MFNRQTAKEKSKTLLRTRTLFDAGGFCAIHFCLMLLLGAALVVPTAVIGASVWTSVSRIFTTLSSGSVSALTVVVDMLVLLAAIAFGWTVYLFFKSGMVRSSLRFERGEQNVRIADIISAGDHLSNEIVVNFWKTLFLLIWNLPAAIALIIGAVVALSGLLGSVIALGCLLVVGFSILYTALVWNFPVFSLIFGASAVIAAISTGSAGLIVCVLIACVWIYIITNYKKQQYLFAEFISEDKRELSGLDCLSESIALTQGHIWDLITLELSLLGWKLISILLLMWINIYSVPYSYLTYASVYEQLKGTFKAAPKNEMAWFSNGSSIQNKARDPQDDPHVGNHAVPGNHALEVISGEYVGTNFPIADGEEIRIGRDPKRANVVIPMGVTAISGLHCSIRFNSASNRYLITDFSTNGTYLDGQRLQKEVSVTAIPGAIIKLAEGNMIVRLA